MAIEEATNSEIDFRSTAEDVKRGGEEPKGNEWHIRFERCSIDDESGCGAEEECRKQRVRAETAGEREGAEGGDQRKENVGRVEGDFRNALVGGDQERQKPRVERRMRLPAHIDVAAHEDVRGVLGMKRLNLRVRGFGEIKNVVALEGLVEKGHSQSEHDRRDNGQRDPKCASSGAGGWGLGISLRC